MTSQQNCDVQYVQAEPVNNLTYTCISYYNKGLANFPFDRTININQYMTN